MPISRCGPLRYINGDEVRMLDPPNNNQPLLYKSIQRQRLDNKPGPLGKLNLVMDKKSKHWCRKEEKQGTFISAGEIEGEALPINLSGRNIIFHAWRSILRHCSEQQAKRLWGLRNADKFSGRTQPPISRQNLGTTTKRPSQALSIWKRKHITGCCAVGTQINKCNH